MNFTRLGLGDPIALSAIHGHGTGELLDACIEHFPPEEEGEEEDDLITRCRHRQAERRQVLARQSACSAKNRVIVADVAGTTRDAVDTRL